MKKLISKVLAAGVLSFSLLASQVALAEVRLFVAHLPYSADEDDVKELFEQHVTVTSVKLMIDRDNGRPRGFGFVEVEDREDADNAIAALNGFYWWGQNLVVQEAR